MNPVIDAWLASVVLGAALASGIVLVVSRVPRWGAPSLSRRIAPYIRDVTDPHGTGIDQAVGFGGVDVRATVRAVLTRAGGMLSGSHAVARRLRQAGSVLEPAQFRARQIGWGLAGFISGGLLTVLFALIGAVAPAVWVLPALGAAGGVFLCDMRLARAASERVNRIEEELPTVLEFLALCLSAGEGILDALRRVSAVGSGALTDELRGLVVDVGTGIPLPSALRRLAADLEVPALSRATEQLVSALERGAPLAQVLHSHAADAREGAKQALIERAGRKEIWMLLPLVFAILPLSVLFAIYPGIFMLRLGLG
ncbi:type II secretion system F family protein [Microbacter sp. GSS18]|nr:type II secretion system F family protein [Microbacter sp. GSS18]